MPQRISEALLRLGYNELRTWADMAYRTFSCHQSKDLYFVDEQGLWVGADKESAVRISDNVVNKILIMAS